jgi:hypothetical protein
MKRVLQGTALLLGAFALTVTAQAQHFNPLSADLGLTYNLERAKLVSVDCGCFWFQGGSFDAAVPLFRGLAAAATLIGDHKTDLTPGVDLSKIAFMAGPRYTLDIHRWTGHFLGVKHGLSIFGEGLFGGAHGFDAGFPDSSGAFSTENALSMQFGGGLNMRVANRFGVRAIEVDYVRTSFRNFASDSQNDLRLAFGVTYHVGGR